MITFRDATLTTGVTRIRAVHLTESAHGPERGLRRADADGGYVVTHGPQGAGQKLVVVLVVVLSLALIAFGVVSGR